MKICIREHRVKQESNSKDLVLTKEDNPLYKNNHHLKIHTLEEDSQGFIAKNLEKIYDVIDYKHANQHTHQSIVLH